MEHTLESLAGEGRTYLYGQIVLVFDELRRFMAGYYDLNIGHESFLLRYCERGGCRRWNT